MRSPRTQTLIRDYIVADTFSESTGQSLEKVCSENILITTAKCCLKIKTGKTHKRIKSLSNKNGSIKNETSRAFEYYHK